MGTQLPSPKRGQRPPIFGPSLLWPNGGCIKMPLGMEVGLSPGDIVFNVDPATPRKKGTPTFTQFLAHVYCGQIAGWMNTPLGTEVDLGPGHILYRRGPSSHKRGTAAPLFSAHVYCGHGRPSQLLLSSCYEIKAGLVTVRTSRKRKTCFVSVRRCQPRAT